MIHLRESTSHRQYRLGGYCHTQALCSNGSVHVSDTPEPDRVTCPKCIELMGRYPNARKDSIGVY